MRILGEVKLEEGIEWIKEERGMMEKGKQTKRRRILPTGNKVDRKDCRKKRGKDGDREREREGGRNGDGVFQLETWV